METLNEICLWVVLIHYGAISIAGWKSAIMNNGVGPFELVSKLWRGEIKSKYHG
jgi:hypothetical protein